jgi:hypothetical protein
MPFLPDHLVSEILSLKNGTDSKTPVIVGINPESGAQTVQPNPVRVAEVKELVKEAVQLLKQHRRAALLKKQIDERIAEEEALEEGEFIDDPEYFREAIAMFAAEDPEIDELVVQCAYSEYGVDDWNMSNEPISLAFYEKAFAIAESIKTLSPRMRAEYLYRSILAIHSETPEFAVSLYTFVCEYADYPELCDLARSFLTEEERMIEDADQEYEPIVSFNGSDSLDVLEWAKKNKKASREWLARVSGSDKEKSASASVSDPLAKFQSMVDGLLELYPHRTREEIEAKFREVVADRLV